MGGKEANKEREYLERLITKAEDTVHFMSSVMKPERERSVCIAFLRCLGIDFSANYIITSEKEPPDIIFNSACFEVLEILDEGRKRHKEWKTKVARLKGAKPLEDNINLSKPRSPITYEEVISLIIEALNKKSVRYGKQVCASLDALVYINLLAKFLNPTSTFTPFDELVDQGWRSVSMVMPPFGRVFYANNNAPSFIRDLVGKTKNEWKNLDTLFDIFV